MSNNYEHTAIENDEEIQANLEELSQKILDINIEQLMNIKNRALIEIFQLGLKLKSFYTENTNLLLKLEKDGEKVNALYKKVHNILFEVNNKLEPQQLLNDLSIEYFFSLRDDVENLLVGLSGYITEISYVHEISREIIHREEVYRAYSQVIENVDTNKLYQKIYNFLIEDMSTLPQKIIEVVSAIPLKIARKKYYDLIKTATIQAFNGNSQERVNLNLDRYKSIFNGSMEFHYGQSFDYYFRKTHELKQLDLEGLTFEKAEKIYDNSVDVLSEVNVITSIIIQIGLLANRFIVLKMLEDKTSDKDDIELEEIINLWNRFNEDMKSKIEEKIANQCEDKINELERGLGEINGKFQELIERFYGNKGQLNETLDSEMLKTQKSLTYLNDVSIQKKELLFEESNDTASASYIEESVNSFIDFLDRNIKKMGNKERKVRMRRLLCLIDNPFKNPDDFFSYLKSSLETNNSKRELIINANLIAEAMSRYKK